MGLVLKDLGFEYASWDALAQIALDYPIKSYMEIGSRYGDSLVRVLSGQRKPEQICIADIWHISYFGANNNGTNFDQSHKHIERMLIAYGYDIAKQVTFLDGDSAETVPLLNPKVMQFDMVLVDGDHNPIPARRDLFNAWPLVKHGGFLVFDDIQSVQHMMEIWTLFVTQNCEEIFEALTRVDKKFGVAVASKKSHALETSKVRERILREYPKSFGGDPAIFKGIDVGCSRDPLTKFCVGFDRPEFAHYPEVTQTGDAQKLPFVDGQFDWLWSSHCLEDFEDTDLVLKEWARVVRSGGMIGLYVPHPDLYKGSNNDHKHPGFTPETLIKKLEAIGCLVVQSFVDDEPSGPSPKYSTLVVSIKG